MYNGLIYSVTLKQWPALYKETWIGRAVSHFILDTELSTCPGRATHKSISSVFTAYSASKINKGRNPIFFPNLKYIWRVEKV